MDLVLITHIMFGERVLPLLIIVAAIWFTVTWKPDAGRTLPGRVFVWLISLQFVLGLIQWIYGIILGNSTYLSFPFILHPLLGLIAVGIAPLAVYQKPDSKLRPLGRWGPLVMLGVLFLIVIGSIITGMARLS